MLFMSNMKVQYMQRIKLNIKDYLLSFNQKTNTWAQACVKRAFLYREDSVIVTLFATLVETF